MKQSMLVMFWQCLKFLAISGKGTPCKNTQMGRDNRHVGSAKHQILRNLIAAVAHPEKCFVTSQC